MNTQKFSAVLIGAVWVFHGLYSKLLDGIPRHAMIVERILGEDIAPFAKVGIGIAEILLGLWVWSERYRTANAAVQTLAIISMNALEITYASDLLVSPLGMAVLNLGFLCLVWWWALSNRSIDKSDLNHRHRTK